MGRNEAERGAEHLKGGSCRGIGTGSGIQQPVVIIGAPRSGTTLLFRCLAMHPELWHLPAESHPVLEGPLHPARTGWVSNRAEADSVSPGELAQLRRVFFKRALNLNRILRDPAPLLTGSSLGRRLLTRTMLLTLGKLSRAGLAGRIRLVEKTPKNSLRVPFMDRLFPDAKFLHIVREPRQNIDSLLAGWRSSDRIGPLRLPRFQRAGYPIAGGLSLKDYRGRWWRFALVPGWRSLAGGTLADVALKQWYECNRIAADDLRLIPAERVLTIRFEDFLADPEGAFGEILTWAELGEPGPALAFCRRLPRVNTAGPMARDRTTGLRFPEEVDRALAGFPEASSLARRLGYELDGPA